jgi:hypothetical protein
MLNRDTIAVAAALVIAGAAILLPSTAGAQFGDPTVITVPGSVTSDQPVESSTTDMDTVQLPSILQQDTTTANSVTTGGGGGNYQPNASYIASLDQQLFSGVNAQNFQQEFPGWVALPANATNAVTIPLTTTVLQTYGQSLAIAASQTKELESEDFSSIEQKSAGATALLAAVQANTEAVLADVQEHQLERQLLATLLTVEATKAAEELNERAREGATNALSFNFGITP